MDLRSEQLKDTYGNLVTTGTTAGSPTSGGLQNGQGTLLTSVGVGTNSPDSVLNIKDDTSTVYDATALQQDLIIERKNTSGNGQSAHLRFAVTGHEGQTTGEASIGAVQLANASSADLVFTTRNVGTRAERMRIGSGGDISFRDGSANEAFYWDASGANLLLGLTTDAGVTSGLTIHKNTGTAGINLNANIYGADYSIVAGATGADALGIYDNDASAYRFLINSSGNVGIGDTASGSLASNYNPKLLVGGTIVARSLTSNEALIEIGGDATSAFITSGKQDGSQTARTLRFEVGTSEAMRIDSDGLKFNGDTATANALDDYEEGTWTPVYAPASGSFTTMTMDVLSATYTKIGRQVTVRAYIKTSNVDATGASGELRVNGLPFVVSSLGWSAISVGYVENWGTSPDSGFVQQSTSYIRLRKTNVTSASDVSDLTTGATANQNIIVLTATYFV